MAILQFPPIESADEDGFLALGGDLEVPSLVLAYSSGIFPWPNPWLDEIPWFSPDPRAVLFLDEFRASTSLRKVLRRGAFTVCFNTNFRAVIEGCAASEHRQHGASTWIREDLVEAYTALHHAGYAHSVESYLGEKLVGGLYGVSIGKMFAGESMFYLEPNASKVAFATLVEHLKGFGVRWIDCQMITPLFESFGAREIPRAEYLKLLATAKAEPVQMFPVTR